MAKVQVTSEQFQHFLGELQDQFWGDLVEHTRSGLKKFLDAWSERERDEFVGLRRYERYEPNDEDKDGDEAQAGELHED